MKRTWDVVGTVADAGGWGVRLDDAPLLIPGGETLRIATAALAEAIAVEWRDAAGGMLGSEVSLDDLPLTRLAGTAQARIAPDPEPVALELARYGETDLLCYRAIEPEALVLREARAWQPWVDWAENTLGARLQVTIGIVHVAQPPAALAAIAGHVAAHDADGLAALGVLVPALGSVVLALAVSHGALDAVTAYELSAVDELFQAELWGEVDDAAERRAQVTLDVALAGRYLALSRS